MSQTRTGEHVRKIAPPTLAGTRDPADEIHLVSTADLPCGAKLHLLRCGEDFSIQLGDEELMGSTDHVSEEALATMTAERLACRNGTILIGGLGMGFTLGAALEAWDARAGIVVAELVPEVLAWAQGPLAHLFGDNLADPRLSVTLSDVHDVIAAADELFDAILLDVDNGPDAFVQDANDRLYSRSGLKSAYAALRPGGILAVWSAYADAQFAGDLAGAGFAVDAVAVPAYAGSQAEMHSLWFARRPAAAGKSHGAVSPQPAQVDGR